MYMCVSELTAFTNLSKRTCLHVVGMLERECGEIGIRLLDDNYISIDVYKDYFEDPSEVIEGRGITLKLIDKFDDPCFNLWYEIILNGEKLTE